MATETKGTLCRESFSDYNNQVYHGIFKISGK